MIDRREVDQMAKFMAAVENSESATAAGGIPTAPRPADPAVAEMKTILERFHNAADHVVSEAPYDRALREALATELTEQGAKIGSWEIRVRRSGKHNLYDVINVINGEALASDLLLYEAAHCLVRILNEGGRINSPQAIELLRAEQEYGGRVHDMALYRHRLTANADSSRYAIFEARYGDAKRRAINAKERICQLLTRY